MDYDYLLRIFLLGDLGCGKSSFVGALLNEKAVHKKIDFKFTYFNVGDKKAKVIVFDNF